MNWLVKITIDRAMGRDQDEEVGLRVVVPPPGAYVEGIDGGEMNTSSGVLMRLSVPTLELVEGDTLVTWLLVGTIDRPMRGDFTVTQWIGVYNG